MRRFIEYLRYPRSLYFSLQPPKKTMSTALNITKQAYEAFGRRGIPAFLKLVADEVDWKLRPSELATCRAATKSNRGGRLFC